MPNYINIHSILIEQFFEKHSTCTSKTRAPLSGRKQRVERNMFLECFQILNCRNGSELINVENDCSNTLTVLENV